MSSRGRRGLCAVLPVLALLAAAADAAAATGITGAPSAPRITFTARKAVWLEWDEPTTNTDGSRLANLASYRIYWGIDSSGCPGPSYQSLPAPSPAPPAGSVVRATVENLLPSATYRFRVTAVNAAGVESACSNEAVGSPTH